MRFINILMNKNGVDQYRGQHYPKNDEPPTGFEDLRSWANRHAAGTARPKKMRASPLAESRRCRREAKMGQQELAWIVLPMLCPLFVLFCLCVVCVVFSCSLAFCLFSWLVGRSVGCSFGWLVTSLVGWLFGNMGVYYVLGCGCRGCILLYCKCCGSLPSTYVLQQTATCF